MSNKLLGITFLVASAIALISYYFFNNAISKNSMDSILWMVPMSIGIGFDMLCGVIGFRKFVQALKE